MVDPCIPCQASVGKTIRPKMTIRETPEDVFQDVSMDFKGPIGGDYYLHLVIDNLSRYPIVQVLKSTKLSELKPALDKTFSMFGIPESVTHDGGPP